MHYLKRITVSLVLSILVLIGWISFGWAETTAQSSHWGALVFPDHDRTVALGFTTDRFTEFDGTGNRYNDIRQTSGFNFWSLSWTERLEHFKGWKPISRLEQVPQGIGLADISRTMSCISSAA